MKLRRTKKCTSFLGHPVHSWNITYKDNVFSWQPCWKTSTSTKFL